MDDTDTRVRATAENLIEVLSAYDDELSDLAQDVPGVAPLREAIGAALAEACTWISQRDAGYGVQSRMTH
jgi:hypothetical protein